MPSKGGTQTNKQTKVHCIEIEHSKCYAISSVTPVSMALYTKQSRLDENKSVEECRVVYMKNSNSVISGFKER